MIPVRILLIRHGDPDYTVDSLTEKGWREAELLSQRLSRLDIAAFYCSPLGRARDTARVTLEKFHREAEVHDFLQEFLYPITDPETGKQFPHAWDFMPAFWTEEEAMFQKDGWLQTPLMRSGDIAGKFKMVADGLDEILARHGYTRKNNRYTTEMGNKDTIAIFCHFGVICVMLSHMLGISAPLLWHGFCGAPSSVTTLISEEREKGEVFFRCQSFGDTSHLYAAGEEPSFAARFCETYESEEERH